MSTEYQLSSSIQENFRRIYLHEESIIAHVWVSSGYWLSSIMQENFSRIYSTYMMRAS